MNTSGRDSGFPGGTGNLPHDWPDVETLARLANQFFSAAPSEDSGARQGAGPVNLNSIPHDLRGEGPLASSSPSPVGLPGDAELKALFETMLPSPTAPLPDDLQG